LTPRDGKRRTASVAAKHDRSSDAFGAGVPLRRYRSRTRAIEKFGFMADEVARRFNVSFETQARRASAA